MAKIHRHALPSGYEFSGFHIESVLGAGGFGITYRARALAGEDRVAIKEYLPNGLATRDHDGVSVMPVSDDDTDDYSFGLSRFRTESEMIARFEHPNLVRTRDFFEANGTAYLIMNFVDGESLHSLLKPDKTLEADALTELANPVLDALATIHDAKVLHRDIKPGNIVVGRDGTPVLIDFGAAREALGEKSQSLTSIFTSGYTPPEQYHRRGNQGPWSDIYALGATLYRCVTGERPPPAVERVMQDDYVPVGAIAKGDNAPPLLGAVDAALRLDEASRPQSVGDWRRMLEGELEEATEATRRISRPGETKLPPARPRKRPGARPLPSGAASPRSGTGSWRRWGTTLASLAGLVIVASTGYYGFRQYQETGGEAAVVRERPSAKPPASGAQSPRRDEEARRRAEEARRRSAREAARRRAEKAGRSRAARPPAPGRRAGFAAGCPIVVFALRGRLSGTDCKKLRAVFDANIAATPKLGQTVSWQNAANRHAWTITFVRRFADSSGRPCWSLRQSVKGPAGGAAGSGVACRLGSLWKIVR